MTLCNRVAFKRVENWISSEHFCAMCFMCTEVFKRCQMDVKQNSICGQDSCDTWKRHFGQKKMEQKAASICLVSPFAFRCFLSWPPVVVCGALRRFCAVSPGRTPTLSPRRSWRPGPQLRLSRPLHHWHHPRELASRLLKRVSVGISDERRKFRVKFEG